MALLSAVIITLNEEKNIRRCLESLKNIADEIVVVDSLSTDETKNICAEFNVNFIEQKFLGYIEQKNFALDCASNKFVLSLDADEALSDQLYQSILVEKNKDFPTTAYRMNRCTSYAGRWIKHGSWYPDRKVRLFDKNIARWAGTNPHDRIELSNAATPKQLNGDILHYTYADIIEQIAQMNKFTTIQARAMFAKNKKASLWNLIINPPAAFISSYIIKLGFLDGIDGLIIAKTVAYQTFLKYAKLRHIQSGKLK